MLASVVNLRYKMPALQLKTEGRLNGVKTKIFNLEDVAKAIRVPPACTESISSLIVRPIEIYGI
jgi:Domain found in IF2B/IF5